MGDPREGSGRPPPRLGGRFQVVDQLGDGGTATVYLAWDQQERGWCALKVLQFRHLRDDDIRRRFEQEAEALTTLQHPNIPRLVAFDPESAPPYMAMELARCGSAMDWVREHGPMPPAMAADVAFQMCEALAAVHAAGMVHRDVKPHNVLLDDLGVCKLTDFGIARVTETTSLTQTGSQIGTFSFMAPEQRTDTKSVDHRADIYSAGSSLFTLLTGRTSAELFVADTDDGLLVDVPEVLRPVIQRATRYRAEDRHPTIQAFQAELMQALAAMSPSVADAPPLVHPPPPLPVGPPATLPSSRRFQDLERSMALDTTQPTFVPTDRQDGPLTGPRKVIPYFMPSPDPLGRASPTGRDGRQTPPTPSSGGPTPGSTPDYRNPGELPPEPSPSPPAPLGAGPAPVTEGLATLTTEVDATSRSRGSSTRSTEGALAPVLRWIGVGVAGATLVAAMAFATVVVGALQVDGARRKSTEAAVQLSEALRVDGNVVYQLPGDKTSFEVIYQRHADATDDTGRLHAALAFVEALEASVAHGGGEVTATAPKLRRLREARETYLRSLQAWSARGGAFPGSLAVTLHLVTGPSPQEAPPPPRP